MERGDWWCAQCVQSPTRAAAAPQLTSPPPLPHRPLCAASPAALAAAAAPGAAPVPRLSYNQPLRPEVQALIIRLSAVARTAANGRKTYCRNTSAPTLNTAEMRRQVFEDEAPPGQVSVGSTYNTCSHGRLRLTQQNSAVPEVVELPCAGTTS